jgi:hypothetical protein
MDIRKLTLAAAASSAICPSISHAYPESAALNACARAFASSIAAPGSAAPSYKLDYRGAQAQSALAHYYGREYTFNLQAHDPKTGVALASATCSANMRGTIVALTPEPLGSSGAMLAAWNARIGS